ncbi:MAG: glycosyltransferase family 2 protein [Thermoprotei archaeon]
MTDIIAILPAFNEEETIAKVILKTQKYVDKVIVVDDGSSDMTAAISEKLGALVVRHNENLGKGAAIKTGFEVAKSLNCNIVVTLDADGQHDPDDIPHIIEPLLKDEADIVIGSRNKSSIPFHRKLGNKLLNSITNIASGTTISDTQSGFRAYSRKALEILEIKDHGIGIESQLIIDAMEKKLRIKEVPINVKYGKKTSTYNFFRHGTYVILVILRAVIEKSPLLYLGVPGVIIVFIGLILALQLLHLYNTTRYFSIPIALLALGGILLGIILIVSAMLLYAIINLYTRLKKP